MLLVTPARVSHARGDSQNSGSVLTDNSSNKSHSIIRPKPHRTTLSLRSIPEEEYSLNGTPAQQSTTSASTSTARRKAAGICVAARCLEEGENVVRLTPLAGDSDVSLVDFIRVTYPRAFTAENNALRFSLANKQQVTIDGFSSPVVRVFDITEPDDIRQVISKTLPQGSGYAVTVSSPKPGGRILLALGDDCTKQVAAITSNLRSNLHDTYFDFVPSRFIDTFWMETVSDDWFADFDADGLAEIALGRLPVRTADETSRIIDKIVSYGIVPATRNICWCPI